MAKHVVKKNGSVTVFGRLKNGKTGIITNLPSVHIPKEPPAIKLPKIVEVQNGSPAKKKIKFSEHVISFAELIAQDSNDVLDVHHIRNILYFGLKSENPKWRRTMPDITKKQWQDFLDKAIVMIENPRDGVIPTAEKLDFAKNLVQKLKKEFPKLSQQEKENLIKLLDRIKYAKFALEREYITVALFKKPSPSKEEVEELVKHHRSYYYSLPEDQRPSVPTQYERGFYSSAFGIPKDPGTLYGFWKTESTKFPHGSYDAGVRFVAFDTETTSSNTQEAEILQIGYGIYNSEGELLEKKSHYVRPSSVTSDGKCYVGGEEAQKVHGITHEHVKEAQPFPEVWDSIATKMQGSVIVGHNIVYDLGCLREHFRKYDMRDADDKPLSTSQIWWGEVDTLKYSRRHVEGVENHKLTTLAEHFGIDLTNAHDAAEDAVASGDLFFTLRGNNHN